MASDNDYILDLSVNSNSIVDELNKTINKLDEAQKKSESFTKEVDNTFNKAAQSSKKMSESLNATNTSIDATKRRFEEAGKAITKTFSDGSIIKMQKDIEAFSDKVKDVSIKRKLEFEVDPAAYKEIEEMSSSLKSQYEEMQNALSDYAVNLAERNKDVGETIDFNIERIKQLNGEISVLEKKLSTSAPGVMQAELLGQMRELTAELEYQEQELVQSEGSYKKYNEEIKKVAQTQKELSASLVSSQNELKARAAAEEKATNEAKKLTEANEGLNSSLLESTGIMGVFDTMTGGMITKFNGAIGATKGLTTGFKTLRIALISTGIGAFVVLLGSLIAYFKQSEEGQDKFAYYMNIIGAVTSKVLDLFADLGGIILNAIENPKQAIKDFGNLIEENITNRVKGIIEYIPQMAKAVGLVFKGEFSEAAETAVNAFGKVATGVDNVTGKFKDAKDATGEWLEETKRAAVEAGKIAKLNEEITVKERKLLIDQANANKKVAELKEEAAKKDKYSASERVKMLQDAGAIETKINNERVTIAKMQEEAIIRSNAISKSTTEDLNKQAQATANVIDMEAKRANKLKELEAELQESKREEKRLNEQAVKDRLAEEQRLNESLLKYAEAYEDSMLELMDDSLDKRLKIVNTEYDRRIESIKRETVKTKEEVEARNKLLVQLEEERASQLLKAKEKYQKDRVALQLEAQSIYLNLQKDSLENSLQLLELDHIKRSEKIIELFADDEQTRIKLLRALEESTQREREKLSKDAIKKELEIQEKLAIESVNAIYNVGKKTAKAEHAKNIEIQKIKLHYAQENLKQIVDDGTEESKLMIAQAKNTIDEMREELEDTEDSKPKVSFWSMLGFDFTEEEEGILDEYMGQLYDNIVNITDQIIDQYDRQIDKKKEVVKGIDKDISNLEKQLDKEKDLREQGFANNVELIEQEIADKEAQREEEIRIMEELNEKKKAIQKAQFIMDTVIQAQNLITASTNIFNSLSGIPFVGVPLAIALIGTMFGSFAASKIKAAQLANSADVSQFESGGLLEGNSHAQGGVKYYSNDKTNIKELEGGEYIVNKRQTAKFLPILEALNSGKFGQDLKREASFRSLLDSAGVALQDDSIKDTLSIVDTNNSLKIMLENNDDSNTYNEMLFYLKRLDEHNRNNTVTEWEEGGKRYIKRGNKTTIITS